MSDHADTIRDYINEQIRLGAPHLRELLLEHNSTPSYRWLKRWRIRRLLGHGWRQF